MISHKINRETARFLYNRVKEIYAVYDNGAEALVENEKTLDEFDNFFVEINSITINGVKFVYKTKFYQWVFMSKIGILFLENLDECVKYANRLAGNGKGIGEGA